MSAELETAEYLQALTIKLIALNNSTSVPVHKILEDHYRPSLHAELLQSTRQAGTTNYVLSNIRWCEISSFCINLKSIAGSCYVWYLFNKFMKDGISR